MKNSLRPFTRLTSAALAVFAMSVTDDSAFAQQNDQTGRSAQGPVLRVATFNASLYGSAAGHVRQRLDEGQDSQAEKVAAIVQIVRPDILLINEIDYDKEGATAERLARKYFARAGEGRDAIDFPYIYVAESNTGVDSDIDLNRNGKKGEPNDAWGYGVYPGQYGMAVFSRYPILRENIRTFRRFLWSELPDALRPISPDTGESYYPDAAWRRLRLSSKNHIDVPIRVDGRVVHLLASHPTPPVFDGKEDRNGCRNHDEIRFWTEYISNPDAAFLVDDDGVRGGLDDGATFFIAGDLNSDPDSGDSRRSAIRKLLAHRRVQDSRPLAGHPSSPNDSARRDRATAAFGRGNRMRVDYVLASRNVDVIDSGVFWPADGTDDHDLLSASDHRLVWVKAVLP